MGRLFPVVRALFILSLVSSVGAAVLRMPRASFWLATPALVFSGWAFVGHLVTLDDDSPGGWSNPRESDSTSTQSSALWHRSLQELALKLAALLALSLFAFWQHTIALSG